MTSSQYARAISILPVQVQIRFFVQLEKEFKKNSAVMGGNMWWVIAAHGCHEAADALAHMRPKRKKK